MRTVSVLPTHVISSLDKITSAWNGIPVLPIEYGEDQLTALVLSDPETVASLYSVRTREVDNSDFSVGLDDVMKVFGNRISEHNIRWLPKGALVGVFNVSEILELSETVQLDDTLKNKLGNRLAMWLINRFCSCQIINYNGIAFSYGTDQCGVHGPFNNTKIESAIANGVIDRDLLTSFEETKEVKASDILLGWIEDDGETFLLAVTAREVYKKIPEKIGRKYWKQIGQEIKIE